MGQLTDFNIQGLAAATSRTSILVALGCLLFSLTYIIRRLSSQPSRPTYSLHPLLPSFLSGCYAAYRMGGDEHLFFAELQRRYGSVVFVPFPVGTHFVLDTPLIKKIYEGSYNKQLSFTPYRLELDGILFNLSHRVRLDKQQRLEKVVFPALAKSLTTKSLLQPALGRFLDEVEKRLDTFQLAALSQEGSVSIDLIDWSFDIMFESSKCSLFGHQCFRSKGDVKSDFLDFDHIFPLLVADSIPSILQPYLPATRNGVLARDRLARELGKWAMETECAGLEEGDAIYDMVNQALKQVNEDGTPFYSQADLGSSVLSEFSALQMNTPYTACWLLALVIQADAELKRQVLEEVDSVILSPQIDAAATPLITSMIYETLRVRTSAFSVRRSISDTTFVMDQIYVKPKEDVILVASLSHFDPHVWGENASVWDPKRFYDAPGGKTTNAERIYDVRSFGGGSSKCEGRTLAMTELRFFLVAVLQRFDIQLDESAASVCPDRIKCVMGGNKIQTAVLPRVKPGRPGAGVYQILGKVPVKVKARRAV